MQSVHDWSSFQAEFYYPVTLCADLHPWATCNKTAIFQVSHLDITVTGSGNGSVSWSSEEQRNISEPAFFMVARSEMPILEPVTGQPSSQCCQVGVASVYDHRYSLVEKELKAVHDLGSVRKENDKEYNFLCHPRSWQK